MTLRKDIHGALDEVTPDAPHLPYLTLTMIKEPTTQQRPAPTAWVALAVAALVVIVAVAALLFIHAPKTTQVPAAPGHGGLFSGTLDPAQSSAPISIANDGAHRLYWRIFVNGQLSDAGFELQIYQPNGQREDPLNRMPVSNLLVAGSRGTWRFIVRNIGSARAAWRLEIAEVPGYPSLSEGTVEGSLPTTELPEIKLAPLQPGTYSLTISGPPAGAQVIFLGITSSDGNQLAPVQQVPADGFTVQFQVTSSSATYGISFNATHATAPPSIHIEITRISS